VRENRKRIFNDTNAINKILSHREQLIIGLICQGLKNKDVADALQLSVRTIENHRYRIMRKLMLEKSKDLIDFGQRLGLQHIV
jgi:DNA-binding NarL/FixJ family response regulator